MEKLTIKSVYFDKNLDIVDQNKDFYIYFETVRFSFSSINDFDFYSSLEKDEFIEFVETSTDPKQFKIFRVKNVSGEYRTNIVLVSNTVLREKPVKEVKLIDIKHALSFYDNFSIENDLLRASLSITNEYMFTYQQKNNIFKLYHFFQNRKTVLYEQDLDSWGDYVVTAGLLPQNQIKLFEQMLENIRSCPETFSFELKCALRGGVSDMEKLNFSAVRLEEGSEVYLAGRIMPDEMSKEILPSKKVIEELQIDSLTKVYNRKMITEFAERRLKRGQTGNCALIIVDLDHFKPVNDAYGHLVGDKVLETTGRILLDIIGEKDFAGRYGGDEFIVLMENIDSEQVLRGVLRSIMVSIRNAFENMFDDIHITASLGCAVFPKDGESYSELFKKADFCLYRAKDKGRDRYVFFREDLHGELYKKAIESKSIGIKYDEREIQELRFMCDYMQMLNKAPFQAIKSILEHMKETYAIDSINIYYGEDMKRVYTVGKKRDGDDRADYVHSTAFKDALGEKNYVKVDFPGDVAQSAKPFLEILELRGIKSTIQCVLGSKDNIRGLVTFDRLKESALWAEYEFNCTVMFAAAMTLLPESVKVDFALYSKLKD